MKQIYCSATPSAIGFQHGQAAKVEIDRGLVFYRDLFQKTSGLSWSEVCDTAAKFEPVLQEGWPQYCEEMRASLSTYWDFLLFDLSNASLDLRDESPSQVHIFVIVFHNITNFPGIARGAEVSYHSILALNVRTEIAYGMSKDGCTALFWRNEQSAFLAQNWDWQEEQQENLINLNINQESKPSISMITEAGIIGKIGLNSSGVGVCLNAIRTLGVDFERLPCHLALRSCLESESVAQTTATLQKAGVASACHILVADSHEAVGLECTSVDVVGLPTNSVLTHTNHLLKPHSGVEDKMALQDSPARLERIDKLVQQAKLEAQGPLRTETIRALLADEDNLPTAICRARTRESSVATLFSIVIDLRKPSAEVTMGRPSEGGETLYLNPRE